MKRTDMIHAHITFLMGEKEKLNTQLTKVKETLSPSMCDGTSIYVGLEWTRIERAMAGLILAIDYLEKEYPLET